MWEQLLWASELMGCTPLMAWAELLSQPCATHPVQPASPSPTQPSPGDLPPLFPVLPLLPRPSPKPIPAHHHHLLPEAPEPAAWSPAGELPQLDLGITMFAILLSGTVLKLALFFYCNWLSGRSDSMEALAEDHINDVASNLGAILAAVVTKYWPAGWWVDPVGAIIIALVILGRWAAITYRQVRRGLPDHSGGAGPPPHPTPPLLYYCLLPSFATSAHVADVLGWLMLGMAGMGWNCNTDQPGGWQKR
jgi:hypothetical protein